VDPPGGARTDTSILLELARRLGRGRYFDHFETSEDIFNELRVASRGGSADYYGITYERVSDEGGGCWPGAEIGRPATRRVFEGVVGPRGTAASADGAGLRPRRFYTSDGRAHFNAVTYRPSAEEPDEEFPVILTTGRVVSQYLSGTQTRRIGGLVDLCPE